MERLFAAIPDVVKGLDADGETSEALIYAAWNECAGPLIVERTKVIGYSGARLIIAVGDASWRAHLEDLSPRIIARLNGAVGSGSVKFIEFRVDAGAFKDRQRQATETRVQPRAPGSVTAAADRIQDTELRKSFLAAAAAYLEKK
jgi:hypothetical protein